MKDRLTICVLISLAAVLILSISLTSVVGQAPAAGQDSDADAVGHRQDGNPDSRAEDVRHDDAGADGA